MDAKKLSEGEDDVRGIVPGDNGDYKLAVLRKCIETVEKDIITSRNCFDYVLSQIKETNERVLKELNWNDKRMELLNEIVNKNQIYVDKLQMYYKEVNDILCMKNDVKDLTIKSNKMNINK